MKTKFDELVFSFFRIEREVRRIASIEKPAVLGSLAGFPNFSPMLSQVESEIFLRKMKRDLGRISGEDRSPSSSSARALHWDTGRKLLKLSVLCSNV